MVPYHTMDHNNKLNKGVKNTPPYTIPYHTPYCLFAIQLLMTSSDQQLYLHIATFSNIPQLSLHCRNGVYDKRGAIETRCIRFGGNGGGVVLLICREFSYHVPKYSRIASPDATFSPRNQQRLHQQ